MKEVPSDKEIYPDKVEQPYWVNRINKLSKTTRVLNVSGLTGTLVGVFGLSLGYVLSNETLSIANVPIIFLSINNIYLAAKIKVLAELEASQYDIEKFQAGNELLFLTAEPANNYIDP